MGTTKATTPLSGSPGLRAVKKHAGMRLVRVWLPDTESPEFIAEAHRQSLAAANSPQAREDQAFVDSISEFLNDSR